MDSPAGRRNVALLALCQALAVTSNMLVVTTAALAGAVITPVAGLATLPLGLQFVAMMIATVPMALVMKRFGRRAGFQFGAAFAAAGGGLNGFALLSGDFVLFCLGCMLYGAFMASAQYYRFAAAEVVGPTHRARAIGYVLAGGVLAALVGPELAKATSPLFAPVLFAGSFLTIVALGIASMLILGFVEFPKLNATLQRSAGRPLREITRQPRFVVALASAMVGYGAMSLIMTATPLAMLACAHDFGETAFVIQWHALGMFAPAFVTGRLIERFGLLTVIGAGLLLIAGCVVINLAGVMVANFWWALLLLGVGWNFTFVGATTLLTTTHAPEERAKVQGLNDLTVFGTVAVASLASGALEHLIGWQAVNLAVLAPLLVPAGLLLWLARKERRVALA